MNITDELRKLADLRTEGHLTEQEFTDAKRRLLTESQSSSPQEAIGQEPPAMPNSAVPIAGKEYRASRWSSGNFFFRDALILSSDGMLFKKGRLFGSSEEHINYKAIASIKVTNGIFLSNVWIETSGGSQPIFINGLWKSEAKDLQDTIRAFQIGTV